MTVGLRAGEVISLRPEDEAFALAAWDALRALQRAAAPLLPAHPGEAWPGTARRLRVRIDSARRRRPRIGLVENLGPDPSPWTEDAESAHARLARARLADPLRGTIAAALRPLRALFDDIDSRLAFDLVLHLGATPESIDLWATGRGAMAPWKADGPLVLVGTDPLRLRPVDGPRVLARFHAVAARGALFHRPQGRRPRPWIIRAEARQLDAQSLSVRTASFEDAVVLGLRCWIDRLWLLQGRDAVVDLCGVGAATAEDGIQELVHDLLPRILDPCPLLERPAGGRPQRRN